MDSPLISRDGLLNLDHLDSYVRSGRSGGWLKQAPEELLERTRLEDGAISADHSAAPALVDLICMEASLHTSWDNIGPASVIRRLAGRALETGSVEPAALAGMVDAELWSLLDRTESTRHESAMLRNEPHRLRVRVAGEASHPNAWEYALRKVYRSAPLIGVRSLRQAAPELAARLDELDRIPLNFTVWWD